MPGGAAIRGVEDAPVRRRYGRPGSIGGANRHQINRLRKLEALPRAAVDQQEHGPARADEPADIW